MQHHIKYLAKSRNTTFTVFTQLLIILLSPLHCFPLLSLHVVWHIFCMVDNEHFSLMNHFNFENRWSSIYSTDTRKKICLDQKVSLLYIKYNTCHLKLNEKCSEYVTSTMFYTRIISCAQLLCLGIFLYIGSC